MASVQTRRASLHIIDYAIRRPPCRECRGAMTNALRNIFSRNSSSSDTWLQRDGQDLLRKLFPALQNEGKPQIDNDLSKS